MCKDNSICSAWFLDIRISTCMLKVYYAVIINTGLIMLKLFQHNYLTPSGDARS